MHFKKAVEAKYQVVVGSAISLDFVKDVAKKLNDTWKKGKHEGELAKLNQYIKKHTPGDLKAFADSAIDYFKKGKLKWNEFGIFQGEYKPGFDIIPWSYLKRALTNLPPAIENELPRAFQERLDS